MSPARAGYGATVFLGVRRFSAAFVFVAAMSNKLVYFDMQKSAG